MFARSRYLHSYQYKASRPSIRLFSHLRALNMPEQNFKVTNWVDPSDKSGEFQRGQSQFRNWIKKGGEFPPEKDRYHLYISYACPWAHRTLIVRELKGLQSILPYTAVHWHMLSEGWRFSNCSDTDAPGEFVEPDPVPGHEKFTHLREVYWNVDPEYKGRFTVPLLYDKKMKRIVSNESAEIIRMMYSEFDDLISPQYQKVNLIPTNILSQIDETNEWTYDQINNGVYKTGFATTSSAYERHFHSLFSALDRVEAHLASSPGPYYWGENITETDVRLYTTMVRFDVVYVQHFKCNLRDVRSGYPHIHRWLRRLYWGHREFGGTTEFTHIKRHYTRSHHQINPFSITPVGPEPDILKEDEEVLAVKYALAMAAKK